jgi:hypothetical protein
VQLLVLAILLVSQLVGLKPLLVFVSSVRCGDTWMTHLNVSQLVSSGQVLVVNK